MVAASLLRELGPVLAGILFASSAGGAMTSEIGLMKTTEQLEAMKVMAVDPIARVVVPRFWAGVISMPLLASIWKVPFSILVTPLGIVIDVSPLHLQKASSPILVTLFGILIDVSPLHQPKALSPILEIGRAHV